MEIRPTIYDRDTILEWKVGKGGPRIAVAIFDMHHALAKMPDVSGWVMSRAGNKSRYNLDILLASEEAAKAGFKDEFGTNVKTGVMAVAENLIDATEEAGELRPNFGEFVVIGPITKDRRPLRKAMDAHREFMRRAGRTGAVVEPFYFVDNTPFTPMQAMPEEMTKLIPRELLAGLSVDQTNKQLRPVAHSVFGAYRQLTKIPEVNGLVTSTIKKADFMDIIVNKDANPQDLQTAIASAKAVIEQLEEYLVNSGEHPPRWGGVVEIPNGSDLDQFKANYLDFAARNRRRSVSYAFYFPQ